ncbi:UDP-N-acetylmuramoyl-L-alanine--D-glutamate ligase [Candidatus Saccharibacteria bacterium]|nr:UDP-N-acetylmuramoyl-L-alanine--D-glutamate ligase [Candidatus Saccharibacteria bacterium]
MKIAIAGFGLEGKSNLKYFRHKFPKAEFVVFDEREKLEDVPVGVETVLGEDAFAQINGFDLVLRTAGLVLRKIPSDNKKIWSATNEFFAECPAQIIGVTGTKGKGTTSTMITEILRAHIADFGPRVHIVGNIGTPALEMLSDIHEGDYVVYELSSFQLWDVEMSPQTAVVLRIEPDHLDVHEDFADYVAAKGNIARWQSVDDAVIFFDQNDYSREIAELSQGHKIPYPDGIELRENILRVQGAHNVENAKAAIAATRAAVPEISETAIEKGLHDFRGLPHRLEFVREVDGVKYYDDNYSSAPGATIAALRAFDVPEILILGGIDKGANYDKLITELHAAKIKKIILVGKVREKLAAILHDAEITADIEILNDPSMREIVAAARESANPGDVIIMSPAHASFDMFKNFTDRGQQFRAEVEKL